LSGLSGIIRKGDLSGQKAQGERLRNVDICFLSGAKLKRSSLTGTVTGFQLADTLASVTNGKPAKWEAPQVSRKSPAGSYAIVGSKLRLKNHNYVFAQDSGNATALTIQP
jgi:hypothetical protein